MYSNHGFLGSFLVHKKRSIEQDLYLVYVMSVIFSFDGGPQKMALFREQLTRVLPIPEWGNR
jgi:hypothetical protein